VLKIQSGWYPSILQGDCIKKIYCLWHKHLALGDRVTEKKGSDSVVFKVVEGKLLCLKFNLEASCQSYWDISLGKNISV
jgi:hypothetical protein